MVSVECLIGGTNAEYLFPDQVAGEDRTLPSQPTSPAAFDRERTIAMTYGRSIRASTESVLTQRAIDRAAGTWGGYQAWRQLDTDQRMELVEQALAVPANDIIDDFPLAL
jgi:hypothetical protein